MRFTAPTLLCVLVLNSTSLAADPDPTDLLGKWELTQTVAGMPVGTMFEFQKDGKLVVTVEKKRIDLSYEMKGKVLKFVFSEMKSDTTEVMTLSKSELVCKDANGTVAIFRRATLK